MATPQVRYVKRHCKHCGEEFEFPIRRGSHRLYCTMRCSRAAQQQKFRDRHKGKVCSVEGCVDAVKNTRLNLCAKHEARQRRTGSVQRRVSTRRVDERGYVSIKVPDHPLTPERSGGWLYEHRAVLYDAIGDGPHNCAWCGTAIWWHDLVVDHLNECKSDNRIDNLLPTCSPCNRARGAMVPFIQSLTDSGLRSLIASFDTVRRVG